MVFLQRRSLLVVFALLLMGGVASAKAPSTVRISGVYMHGFFPGTPGDDTAIRVVNMDEKRPAKLDGLALTDQYTPRKRAARKRGRGMAARVQEEGLFDDDDPLWGDGPVRRGRPATDAVLRFPAGAQLGPGEELWVAYSAKAFEHVFGQKPGFELLDTDASVPKLEGGRDFIWLNEGYGTVALVDGQEAVIDYVAWQGPKEDMFSDGALDGMPWRGPPIAHKEKTPFGWTGRVLARARDERGKVLPDTDRAQDWPVSFSERLLGTAPTHRVEFAGQSHFVATRLRGVQAEVLATSAPDNNYATLIEALDQAEREIRVRIYQFTSGPIAEALMRAKARGVKVIAFLEGVPVGGLPDQSRWITERLYAAGIPVYFLAKRPGSQRRARYRFDHSKYILIDDDKLIVGTENYGSTGVPLDPSYGNRGWMVHVRNKALADALRAVWDHDFREGKMSDIVAIEEDPSDAFGYPTKDPSFEPRLGVPSGLYHSQAKPAFVKGKMDLELVLSPDTSLNEGSALLGMIARAKKSLILQQNSAKLFWGKQGKQRGGREEPILSLPLQAVVKAARRGVKVRILLDGTWYNTQLDEENDNDDTVRFFNELAEKEGLDIRAKVINLHSTHLDKIHAKGLIVDDREVFIGSINWVENSFMGNREVGVIVSHPQVAKYYADLFRRDWSQSRLYTARAKIKTPIYQSIGGRKIRDLGRGEPIAVVHEPAHKGKGMQWAEVSLGLHETGYIALDNLGQPEVTPWETAYVLGREATVRGKVVSIRRRPKVTTLYFETEQRSPFIAVIFKQNERFFTAAGIDIERDLLGKEVTLWGEIKVFGKPEIILSSPDQLSF